MKISRLKSIEEYITKNEHASIDELCSLFKVSKNTIRRDISELEKRGIIKKIYGGIVLNKLQDKMKVMDVIDNAKNITNIHEKDIIAKVASRFVEDRDIIYVDSGVTTVELIKYLQDKKSITIITDNLNILIEGINVNNATIMCAGGILNRKTKSLSGAGSMNFFANYNIRKAFMSTTGISVAKGVTSNSPEECEIKKTIVEKCRQNILLADHSKFNAAGLLTYCSLKDINVLVTDETPPGDISDYLKENDVEVVVAK